MATTHIKPAGPLLPTQTPKAVDADWTLGNPWLWTPLGFALVALAFLWARVFGDSATPLRFTLLLVGLFCAGGGLIIRLKSPRVFLATLASGTQNMLIAILFLLDAALALGITGMVLASAIEALGWAWWNPGDLAWKPGSAVVVWFIVVPASVVAAQSLLQRLQQKKMLSASEESSIMLLLCGLTLFLAAWALYLPDKPHDWDTMRLFLAVFAAVTLIASLLPVLPLNARRALISGLIVLHFGGICTATLSAPPFAWITGQVWTRLYRPYLEFMYLNNAYHFYSPEPGPASFFWFALTYRYEEDGKEYDRIHWVKIPDVDDDGMPQYLVGLTYQRYLSLTENAAHADAMPPMQVLNKQGQLVPADFVQRRMDHAYVAPVVVGEPPRRRSMIIPFANFTEVPLTQQYAAPILNSKRLIESFARDVCQLSIPDLPEEKVLEKRVKIYRVTHAIPYPDNFRMGQDPQDPRLYRAVFVGEYDAKGNLVDKEEPFLYWLLPNLVERPNDRNSPIISYARKHARDPRCRYLPDKKQWVEETP